MSILVINSIIEISDLTAPLLTYPIYMYNSKIDTSSSPMLLKVMNTINLPNLETLPEGIDILYMDNNNNDILSRLKNSKLYEIYLTAELLRPEVGIKDSDQNITINNYNKTQLSSDKIKFDYMYKSQLGQDKLIDELCNFKENGVFIDVGANDGLCISNTVFFEKNRKWKGLCIEPLPFRYSELVKNRSCNTFNGVCSNIDKKDVSFMKITGHCELLSGILEFYDQKHLDRIKSEMEQFGGTSEIIKLPSLCLSTLFDKYKYKTIDYLSVDTEGSEFEVLQGIDFKRHSIKYITVESNYNDSRIDVLLKENGFKCIAMIGGGEYVYKSGCKHSWE